MKRDRLDISPAFLEGTMNTLLLNGTALFHLSSAALQGSTSLLQPVVQQGLPLGWGPTIHAVNTQTHNSTLPPWWEATPTQAGNDAGKIPRCSSHGPCVPALLAVICREPGLPVHCLPYSPCAPSSPSIRQQHQHSVLLRMLVWWCKAALHHGLL